MTANDICPYEQFVSLTESMIPSDWSKECNGPIAAQSMQTQTGISQFNIFFVLVNMFYRISMV